MRPRSKNLLWNIIACLALIGIVFCAIDMVEAYGTIRGLLIVVLLAAFGFLVVGVLYPLWIGRSNG